MKDRYPSLMAAQPSNLAKARLAHKIIPAAPVVWTYWGPQTLAPQSAPTVGSLPPLPGTHPRADDCTNSLGEPRSALFV